MEGTKERPERGSLASRATTRSIRVGSLALSLAALLAVTLALTPRAEAYIYWTNAAGYIQRANLDGTPSVAPRKFGDDSFITTSQHPGTSDAYPVGVEVDGGHIYWANNALDSGTTVGRANIDGTGVERSFITGASAPVDVTVDAEHVYWSNAGIPPDIPPQDTIGRANLDGTGVDQSFISLADFGVSEVTSPGGVAVDGAHVYWAHYGFYGRTIGRANLDGSDADTRFIRAANDPRGVAVDGSHIYWANIGAGTIGRANLDGTGVNPSFITGATLPQGVAIHGGHIYWTNQDPDSGDEVPGAAIGRANLDGTGVDHSFIPGPFAEGLAVDALRSFSFGKAKRNRKKGTAKLVVEVAGPGEVALAETDRVKPKHKRAEAAEKVKLAIKPSRKAKKRLTRKGKARVVAEITYTPTGDDPNVVANTNTTTVKLVKRG